jgi:hypothetical protein
MQAEVTQVIGYKMLQQRLAALVAKKDFITNQNVSGTKLASALERLQDVTHQCAGKVARETLQRRRLFLEKAGHFARDLILLAKAVIRVFKQHAPAAIGQCNFHRDSDYGAGDAAGLGIVGERRCLG